MRVLVISTSGWGLGVAWRLQLDGHDVSVCSSSRRVGHGLYYIYDSWREGLDDSDLIVFDGPAGQHEKLLSSRGKIAFGCSRLGDVLNNGKQADFLATYALDYDFSEKNEEWFGVHGFFNGRTWTRPFFISFNEPTMFPDGIGMQVGTMGATVYSVNSSGKAIARYLLSIEDGLKKIGYFGMVNVLVDKSGKVWKLYLGLLPVVFYGIVEGLKEPLIDMLFGVSSGTKDRIQATESTMVSVWLSRPPWPYQNYGNGMGADSLVSGIEEGNLRHIHPIELSKNGEDTYMSVGPGLMFVTAIGLGVKQARGRVYRTISNIKVHEMQYRTDIGLDCDKRLADVKAMGLI